jgi:hypothetical protein
LSETYLTVSAWGCGKLVGKTTAKIHMTPLLTESSDPLALHLLDKHQQRYERIKAWRELQVDPYFSEVTPQWRREFEERRKELGDRS